MFQLTEKQREIIKSNAKIKLIMGGMRSGKTVALLGCVGKAMKQLNSETTKILIHVPGGEKNRSQLFREIQNQISKEIIVRCYPVDMIIETIYGTIEVDTFGDAIIKSDVGISEIEKELAKCDIIAADNSTSSSLFGMILNAPCDHIIMAGHCPENRYNPFYKTWCVANCCNIADTEAFHMNTWDNPDMIDRKEKYESKLINSMGFKKYAKDYYATFIE